ncbi:MAG: hypothetical protein WCK37_02825 [Candidatus Falkowbacteria bacterium]
MSEEQLENLNNKNSNEDLGVVNLETPKNEGGVFEEISQASTPEELEKSAADIKAEIVKNLKSVNVTTEALLNEATKDHKEFLEPLTRLREEAKLTSEKIDSEVEKIKTTEHLPNYDALSKEAALVEINQAPIEVQKRFNEQISPRMKDAMSTVGGVFNQCKSPYALIGSNCYIPHTKYSQKIPDDLDVIFGVQDLGFKPEDVDANGQVTKFDSNSVYGRLAAMDNVEIVEVKEMTRFGKEKNGCFKIKAKIKTASGESVEMEAFAQHMQSEIDEGQNTNGLINLGIDKQGLEVVDCNGVKVNIGNEDMAEELYLKNIMNEFPLYNLNGWENKGCLNAKALQRIFNVINLDHENFESSIDDIITNIGKLKPPTEAARQAQVVLSELWVEFKAAKHFDGAGLVDHLVEKNGLEIKSGNLEEEHILKTEAAVDIMTNETRMDMESMSAAHQTLKNEIDNYDGSNEELRVSLLEKIDDEIKNLSATGQKYKAYMREVDGKSPRDFCVYAAMPRVRNFFIRPIMSEMIAARKKLDNK